MKTAGFAFMVALAGFAVGYGFKGDPALAWLTAMLVSLAAGICGHLVEKGDFV